MAFAVAAPQLDLAELAAGIPVVLNRPAASAVSVAFRCEASGTVLTNGTLAFAPGQALQTLMLPSVAPGAHDLLRLTLVAVDNARLAPASNVFFLPANSGASPVLVAGPSRWSYRDTGGDPGPAWSQPAYDDRSWSNGLAQLGFGDQDETTPIRRIGTNGQSTVTFYFRQEFQVPNPALFTKLALSLLRDDGGVIYVNGAEVYRSPTLPPPPTVIAYTTLATNLSVSDAPPDNTADRTNLNPALLVAGTNLVAVEIHQHRTDSSDVSFELTLTGEPAPPAPLPELLWGRFADGDVLAWSDARFGLETAEHVTGPWLRLDGAWSPFGIPGTSGTSFYRLRR